MPHLSSCLTESTFSIWFSWWRWENCKCTNFRMHVPRAAPENYRPEASLYTDFLYFVKKAKRRFTTLAKYQLNFLESIINVFLESIVLENNQKEDLWRIYNPYEVSICFSRINYCGFFSKTIIASLFSRKISGAKKSNKLGPALPQLLVPRMESFLSIAQHLYVNIGQERERGEETSKTNQMVTKVKLQKLWWPKSKYAK